MNPLTLEWIDKAEGDFLTAKREIRVRVSPNFDAVCFHAQQSAEKYLKAVLQEHEQPIPRIHSLAEILALCMKIVPSMGLLQADLMVLEEYAVQFRYPGRSGDKEEAKMALKAALIVRQLIRTYLVL